MNATDSQTGCSGYGQRHNEVSERMQWIWIDLTSSQNGCSGYGKNNEFSEWMQ